MEEAWEAGKKAAPGVPDGIYEMQLQGCELRESSSGKMMIAREHIITEGACTGEVVRDYLVLETEYGPRQVAEFFKLMGYDDVAAGDVEDTVAAIATAAPRYQAQVKKGKDSDMRNVRIRAVFDGGGNGAAAPKAKAPVKSVVKPAKAPSIPKGTNVTFSDESGTEFSATVKGGGSTPGSLLVEAADGECYEVAASDVTVVELEAEAAPIREEDEEAADNEQRAALIAFCQANEIEVTEDDTVEQCTEKLNAYEFEREELTDDEYKLLKGIGSTINEPKEKPKPKPVMKPVAAKAPVKSVAKPAKNPVVKKVASGK